jgi:hypothetical protein
MSSRLLRITLSLGSVFGFIQTAFGQGGGGISPSGPPITTPPGTNTLTNPLSCGSTANDPGFLCVAHNIINALFWISLPIATMILVGAFQILTAAGDETKFATGKRTIVYAVVGLAAIIVGLGGVDLIQNILGGQQ